MSAIDHGSKSKTHLPYSHIFAQGAATCPAMAGSSGFDKLGNVESAILLVVEPRNFVERDPDCGESQAFVQSEHELPVCCKRVHELLYCRAWSKGSTDICLVRR